VVTEAKDFLGRNHGIVSLESGTLGANVRRSIAAKGVDRITTARLTNAIVSKVNTVVTFMSRCRRWMHWAIELFISNQSTPREDLDALMNSNRNGKIVYWIGSYLTMDRDDINAAGDRYPLAKRIVLQAYNALGTTDAVLDERPLCTTHIFDDMVRFVITEYTRFFNQGDERLRDKVTFVQADSCIRVPKLQQLTTHSCVIDER
jgi:hypothetical protein